MAIYLYRGMYSMSGFFKTFRFHAHLNGASSELYASQKSVW